MINMILFSTIYSIVIYSNPYFICTIIFIPYLTKKTGFLLQDIIKIVALIITIYIYVGFFNINLDNNHLLSAVNSQQIIVHDNLNYTNEYNITFIGRINRQNFMVSIPKKLVAHDLKYGDTLVSDAYDVQPLKNKYQNPSSFKYEKYMRQQKVINKLIIKQFELYRTFKIQYIIKNFRNEMINKINIDKPLIASYLNTLVFGENLIDQDVKKIYSSVGITHALTISGTHIILLLSFYKRILRSLNIYEDYIQKSLFMVLPIYALLTGGQIPILRAVIVELGYISMSGKLEKITILKLLCITNLIFNPNILFNISFMLSYSICFFIYFIESFDFKNNKLLNYVKPSLLIMLFIFPIIANLNYQYNFFSFICSIILTPLITLILLPMSFICIFLTDTSIISTLFLYVIKLVEMIAYFFDYFTLTTGFLNWYFIFLYYTIFSIYYFKNHIIYLSVLIFLVIMSFININIVGSVSIIDVGQGDAILIEFPFNQGNVLIDTGPESSRYEVVKYLQYMGIDKINHLFITHWHNDHYGGNELLFATLPVEHVYSFPSKNIPIEYNNLIYIKAGDQLLINNIPINILSPFKQDDNLNNESLTLLMELGGKKWLFTGDIEADVETQIIDHYPDLLDIDYLKVPHHGSKTSSSINFLKYTTPEYALISVGENNRFKHPSKEVIQRYADLNINVLQTKDDGIIRYNFIFKYIWYNK